MTSTGWGARAIWRQAQETCTPACFPYHATWPLARAAGLKACPRWHADYYRAQLTGTGTGSGTGPADGDRLRVLVAGAADHTVLQVLADVLDVGRLDVLLVDRCDTPLTIARRWATAHHLDLTTGLGDLQDLDADGDPFDLAVCDGVLSLLPSAQARHDVLTRIAAALAQGGRLVYTTRLTRGARPLEYDLVGRVLQASGALSRPGPVAERIALARHQWRRPARSAPYTAAEQLFSDLEEHFAEVDLSIDNVPATWALQGHPRRLIGAASSVVRATARTPSRGNP